MITIEASNESSSIICPPPSESNFEMDLEISQVLLSSGSTSSITIGDANYIRNSSSTVRYDGQIVINSVVGKPYDLLYRSADPNKSTIDELGYVQTITSGSVDIFCKRGPVTKKETHNGKVESPQIIDTFQGFVEGSLASHIYEKIREYADESTSPPNHYPLYSTFNFTNNNYVKNASSWVGGLDFSGLMVNKSGSGGVTMVTAITPHHAIGVTHYPPAINDIIYFCDSNNQTVSRTVQSVLNITSVSNSDCCIIRFTEELPSTVKKYKMLPTNYKNYIPINREFYYESGLLESRRGAVFPVVVCSHYRWDANWPLQRPNRYAYFYEVLGILESNSVERISFFPAASDANNFVNYNGQPSGIRGGDSGGPCFFIINDDLVLVTCLTTAGGGSFHTSFIRSIQAAINALGPSGQTIQTVDLSGFTDFSS